MSQTRKVWIARDKDSQDDSEYTISDNKPIYKPGDYYNFDYTVLGDFFGQDTADLLGLTLEEGKCKQFEITVRECNETE